VVKRISITIDEDLYNQLNRAMVKLGESNRSRFLANLVREALKELEQGVSNFALVIVVYDHRVGEVDKTLTEIQHEYRDIIRVTTHIHLDERHCAEVLHVLGDASRVEELVRSISLLRRGLKYVKVVPVAY